jgi:heme-degrading monooxygenase HmoA
MFVSVTRLRLRSVRFLPRFIIDAAQAARQTGRSSGFLRGRVLPDRGMTFWTITLWQDEQAMRNYRSSGRHGLIMRRLAGWCSEAAVVHWTSSDAELPDWTEAHRRLSSEGRLSKVDHPSPEHIERRFREPRTSLSRSL